MAQQYIGGTTGTNSCTLPAGWQAGDLAVVFAYRDGNTGAPTIPATFTSLLSAGANSNSAASASRVLQAGDSSFTFTNSTSVICLVYRGVGGVIGIGNRTQGGTTGTNIVYPAVTLSNTSGSSWVIRFAGHRSTDVVITVLPSGHTLRQSTSDGVDVAAGFDTNGGVASAPKQTTGNTGTSSGYRAHSIELTFTPDPPTITSQPSNQTVNFGATASFSVTATGATAYQWQYFNGTTWTNVVDGTGGNTANYTTGATDATYNGRQIRCAVSNSTGVTYSNIVTITVNSLPEYVRVSFVEFTKIAVAIKRLKYWNGSAWVTPTAKYWNGTDWVIPVVKYWNGTDWVE